MTQTPEQRRFVRLAGSINAKASRLGVPGVVTAVDLAVIYMQSNGHCTYCDIGIDPMHCSFDHVIPFHRRGPNVRENVVACCMTCQRGKSTKPPEEYEQARNLRVNCEVCGKPFKPRWADWNRGYGHTCSRACSGKKGGETRNPASSAPGRAK